MKTVAIAIYGTLMMLILAFAFDSNAATAKATIKVVTKQEKFDNCVAKISKILKPTTVKRAMLIVDVCRSR